LDGHSVGGEASRAQVGRRWPWPKRRVLLGRLVLIALDRAVTVLVEALADDEVRVEVWRLAASRTGRLLVVLGRGAAGMGRPLPREVADAAVALGDWSMSARLEPGALPPSTVSGSAGGRVRVVAARSAGGPARW
jgi:hypothetical protein